jgi:hypothetical protein
MPLLGCGAKEKRGEQENLRLKAEILLPVPDGDV